MVVVPLFALLPDTTSPGAGFTWDFAMALGYAALAMLGVQFALTARFRRATAPFGIDLIYYFHRHLAVFALLVISPLLRGALRIEYDFWRWTHALIATIAFALALWHMLAAGRYLDTAW